MTMIDLQNEDVFDAVIVGSGPCGASTAKRIVDSGANVLIIEKATLPRFKMCGGMLAPEAQNLTIEYFGEIPDSVCCSPKSITGFKVFYPEADPLEFPLGMLGPEGEVLNISRERYDYWLAESSGAKLKDNCTFISYSDDPDGTVSISIRDKDKDRKIKAKYLVGADGADSDVRKALSPDLRSKIRWLTLYEEWYKGRCDLDSNWYYGWVISQEEGHFGGLGFHDGLIQVVVGSRKGPDVRNVFQRFRDTIEYKHGLQVDQIVRTAGCIQNNMGPSGLFVFGRGNVLLAGEAAGLLAIASEGITPALWSGNIAGGAILDSMKENVKAIDIYLPKMEPEGVNIVEGHKLAKDVFSYW
ncbi:MAG: NAD(P)/FAD-dependent oxidoreductase [Candidatus Zixiibacteriota bacterium]